VAGKRGARWVRNRARDRTKKRYLWARLEGEVARLAAEGLSRREIGERAGISGKTAGRVLSRALEGVARMSAEEMVDAKAAPPPAPIGSVERRMVAMYVSNNTFADIADELGKGESSVKAVVYRELERLEAERTRHAEATRGLHLEQIRVMTQALWPKAMKGDENAINTIIRLQDRASKLVGLDTPVRINIEDHIRDLAVRQGFDPDEAVAHVKQARLKLVAR